MPRALRTPSDTTCAIFNPEQAGTDAQSNQRSEARVDSGPEGRYDQSQPTPEIDSQDRTYDDTVPDWSHDDDSDEDDVLLSISGVG